MLEEVANSGGKIFLFHFKVTENFSWRIGGWMVRKGFNAGCSRYVSLSSNY